MTPDEERRIVDRYCERMQLDLVSRQVARSIPFPLSQPAPAPDDAAALAAALHLVTHNHSGLPASADATCGPSAAEREFAVRILAALPAHPPAPLPLDVERLAQAMRLLPPIPEEFLVRKTWVESDWLPNARDYARAIAAEYARPEPTE